MDERIGAVTSPLVLTIDQGTHASRALVFDRHRRTLSSGVSNIIITYPQADRAEQDGDEIVNSVHVAAMQALQALGPRRQDRRAHAWIDRLQRYADSVHRKTGLFLSPHYGASKLRWALDHLPAVRAALEDQTLCWGPMASFVVFRLCAEQPFLADPQCAARTQLWNLHTQDWDPELLELFGLPTGFLPHSVPTCYAWGTLDLPGTAIPLTAVNGDQSAAVFAFGWREAPPLFLNGYVPAAQPDSALQARYRRWPALMAQATGIQRKFDFLQCRRSRQPQRRNARDNPPCPWHLVSGCRRRHKTFFWSCSSRF